MTAPQLESPDAPGSGDRFVNADHLGELLVVTVKSHEQDVQTDAGITDVIVADVLVVDGPNAGQRLEDAWLFGKVLQGQLKRKIGKTVVGRFAQGTKQPGKSAPWQLDPASPAETQQAQQAIVRAMQLAPAPAAQQQGDPWAASRPTPGDEPPF